MPGPPVADVDRVVALAGEDHRADVVALEERLELAARIGNRRDVVQCVDDRPALVLGRNRRRKSRVPARHPELEPTERLPQHPVALEPVRQNDHRFIRLEILSIEPGGEELGRRQRRGPERSVEGGQERKRDSAPASHLRATRSDAPRGARAHPHRAQNRDREEHVDRQARRHRLGDERQRRHDHPGHRHDEVSAHLHPRSHREHADRRGKQNQQPHRGLMPSPQRHRDRDHQRQAEVRVGVVDSGAEIDRDRRASRRGGPARWWARAPRS